MKNLKKTEVTDNWYQNRIKRSMSHQTNIYQAGINRLSVLERDKKNVKLESGHECVEFMSCSYLGLECDERIIESASESVKKFGVQFAAARTRMGCHSFYDFESKLTDVFRGPTVTFATCGLTHLAVLPLLGSRELPSFPVRENGVYWILDKTAHASIQILRAIMQQYGVVARIDFTNVNDIRAEFKKAVGCKMTPVTVSDGIGSMGGNAPVEELVSMAENYDGYFYVDDAHGTSIIGQNGCGFAVSKLGEIFHPRLLLISSLSKAFGATGGSVSVFRENDAEFIRRFSNPYIFGGPLSLPGVFAGIASADIHLSEELAALQKKLYENILYFDSLPSVLPVVNRNKLIPIRGILAGSEQLTISLTQQLLARGFATTCVTFPAVEKGRAMIRVAISSLHEKSDLSGMINCVNAFVNDAMKVLNP